MGNGLFGDLDMDEIPENPFFIEEGYYPFVVTKAKWERFEPNDGSGNVFHNTTYTVNIDDPGSIYNGKPVQQRFARYPDITRAKLEEMNPQDKQKVLESLSRHMEFLRGIGLGETEISVAGDSEDSTIEVVLQRRFTAKYKETSSENKGENGEKTKRTYRNLQNMKPITDAEPEDTSTFSGLADF